MKFALFSFFLVINCLLFAQESNVKNDRPNYLFQKYLGIGIGDTNRLNILLKQQVNELLDTLKILPIDQKVDYSKKYKHIYNAKLVYNEDWMNTQTIVVPDFFTGKPTQRTVATRSGYIKCSGEDKNIKITDKYPENAIIHSYGGKYLTISDSYEGIGNSTNVHETIYFFVLEEK
jgi:hypothetical protein